MSFVITKQKSDAKSIALKARCAENERKFKIDLCVS